MNQDCGYQSLTVRQLDRRALHRSGALSAYGGVDMESRQREIFEDIHDDYYASTGDRYAHAYKERYIFNRVASYIGDARTVMEIACGRGEASGWLRERKPGLSIAGCDISTKAATDFTAAHQSPCFVADLTKPFHHGQKYDAVIVMGGIHHLVADLDVAFENIGNLLKPGGRLIMAEPNADYFLNPVRRLWYRVDKGNFDVETEEALSHNRLLNDYGGQFKKVGVRYFGGPAYFLLALNMFLRIPNASKRLTAPLVMAIERVFDLLPGRLPFASFVACWERR